MSVCLPEPAENIDPLFLRFLRSSLHYSPMAVPLADGFDSSQVNRPLEHMGDHLLSNLGISPPSCVSEFDFGESQAMGRTRTGLHFLDLPSSSTNSSFNLSSSNNRFPLGIPLSCDPLDLNLLTAPSSTTRPFFDIPPHTSLLLPDVSTNGCTPPSHLPPALSFNSDNPFLLESSFSSDPLDLYLLTASSYGTHTLSDIVSPNSLSSLDALASGDPLELHLLMASSSTSRPSFDVSFPNDNNPPIPGSSPTGDPLGLCLLSASPSNGAHSLFDTSPSSSLSPLGIPPSGDPLEPHPPAVSSSSNIGSSPPDIPSSHDLPELRPHDASSTRSNTPTPVGTTLDPDPTNSHGMPSNRTVVLASRVPVDLQDVDKEDPDNIPLFMNECDRRTYECIWSHGGGRTCGYRGRFAQAKRHIARVHFELKCVSESPITPATDTKTNAGNTNVKSVKSDSTPNTTLAFTRTPSE